MSLGKYKKESLGCIPNNFYVYTSVPQLEVLQKSSLFITHGGMNSVNESIYYSVPMLVSPIGGDQLTIADRVEELGLGKRIEGNKIAPNQLRWVSFEIMNMEQYKYNLRLHSDYMKSSGAISKAVERIENVI